MHLAGGSHPGWSLQASSPNPRCREIHRQEGVVIESADRESRRPRLRDVIRYDPFAHIGTLVAGVIWAGAAGIWLLAPEVANQDGPRDAALILASTAAAWAALIDVRRRRIDRLLRDGRPVEARVELSLRSGHWLRVTLSFSNDGIPTERTLALADTRPASRLSRGDRVQLVTSLHRPKAGVLPDVLFRTFDPSRQDTAPPRGPDSPIDLHTENTFRTAPDGRRVFLPWGHGRRGYVLASADDEARLRRASSRFLMLGLFGGFLGFALGTGGRAEVERCEDLFRMLGLALLGGMPGVLGYAIWVRVAVRGLPEYQGPPLPLPRLAAILQRSSRGEWRVASGVCAGLGVLCLALGLVGAAPPCLAISFAATGFAGAVAFYRAAHRTASNGASGIDA